MDAVGSAGEQRECGPRSEEGADGEEWECSAEYFWGLVDEVEGREWEEMWAREGEVV